MELEWDPSCESMIFNSEGLSLQGITGGFGIDRRVDFILDPKSRRSTYKVCSPLARLTPLTSSRQFYIEVSCNAMFGNGLGEVNNPPDNNKYFKLVSADLVVPRMEAWRLLWDFRTIRDLAKSLPETSPLGNKCMEVGNAIMNTFKANDLASIAKARKLAEKVRRPSLRDMRNAADDSDRSLARDGRSLERESTRATQPTPRRGESVRPPYIPPDFVPNAATPPGNCHIDTAWLWPYSVTQQKTARSWSTQVDLMNRYPEHAFVASQAQQFAWLERDYPLLFQEIQGKVESGQFQPIGGCWVGRPSLASTNVADVASAQVEMDTNMPSGEALCRQFLYGQRYYKKAFGKYTRTFWCVGPVLEVDVCSSSARRLPDSFGYSSQLPQLCRLAGLDFFFTYVVPPFFPFAAADPHRCRQKLSWSQFNAPVHTSFQWVGQDGSQVLTVRRRSSARSSPPDPVVRST